MEHPDVPQTGIKMVREDMDDVPDYAVPDGYSLRTYRAGDDAVWTAIHMAADPYIAYDDNTFAREFGSDANLLAERQFYLCDSEGEGIGTASAWWDDDFSGKRYGLVHWVAIVPQMQGKGLAKPLMSAVCGRIRDLGDERAVLGTSTWRIPAVNLYLHFGFAPHIRHEEDRAAWKGIQPYLKSDVNV